MHRHITSFTIIVKGNFRQAVRACAANLPEGCEVRFSTASKSDTTLRVSNYPEDSIAMWKWFGAPPIDAPYPVGSLLHFSF